MEELSCPECGGPMVSRSNRKTGQRFWGCRTYPLCGGTRNTDGESPEERGIAAEQELPSDRWRQNDRTRWR